MEGSAKPIRRTLETLSIALLAAAAGCGERAESPEQEAAASVTRLAAQFEAGNLKAVCRGLTDAGRARIVAMSEAGCAGGLATVLAADRARTSPVRPGRRTVTDVRVRGDRATATVTLGTHGDGHLQLARERGGWKLDDVVVKPVGIAGTGEGPDSDYDPWGGRSVCLTSQPRRRCVARVTSAATEVLLLTAFGDFAIARCRFAYSLQMGRTVHIARRVRFSGPGCEDIRHCADREGGLRYPWLGNTYRQTSPDAAKLAFDICVNTPAGRVRGFHHVRLFRRGGTWHADAYDLPVGPSGFQLAGRAAVRPDNLEFRPRPY